MHESAGIQHAMSFHTDPKPWVHIGIGNWDYLCNSFFFIAGKGMIWRQPEKVTAAGTIVAVFAHDMGHFARSSKFLPKTSHELAILYNDRQVLESYHASTLVQLLLRCFRVEESNYKYGQLFAGVCVEAQYKSRQLMIMLVLHTDT